MRYARTDERVIDKTKCKEYFLCQEKCWQPEKGFLVYEHAIRKESNILDELCDEFIGTMKDGTKELVRYRPKYNYVTIYGAIWTDKGLKYVAKVNSNGELELL